MAKVPTGGGLSCDKRVRRRVGVKSTDLRATRLYLPFLNILEHSRVNTDLLYRTTQLRGKTLNAETVVYLKAISLLLPLSVENVSIEDQSKCIDQVTEPVSSLIILNSSIEMGDSG